MSEQKTFWTKVKDFLFGHSHAVAAVVGAGVIAVCPLLPESVQKPCVQLGQAIKSDGASIVEILTAPASSPDGGVPATQSE